MIHSLARARSGLADRIGDDTSGGPACYDSFLVLGWELIAISFFACLDVFGEAALQLVRPKQDREGSLLLYQFLPSSGKAAQPADRYLLETAANC